MVFIPVAILRYPGEFNSQVNLGGTLMSREDLDELNRQIAIYKAGSAEPPQGLPLNDDPALEQEANALRAKGGAGCFNGSKRFSSRRWKEDQSRTTGFMGGRGGDFTPFAWPPSVLIEH